MNRKVLLILPYYYSLKDSLRSGFAAHNYNVASTSFYDQNNSLINKIDIKTTGFPFKFRKYWNDWLIGSTQQKYLNLNDSFKPDIVVIYNNEHVSPATIEKFRKKSKIVFILGDHPLMSKTDPYNLLILEQADCIVCPDSYWKDELELLGIKNIVLDFIGTNQDIFFPIINDKVNFLTDISFIGRTYRNADGYKRALYLSKFTKYKLMLYTHYDSYWNVWLKSFPKLEEHIQYLPTPLSSSEVNKIYNNSALAPIDSNSGLINGIHLRFFDILSAGCLPIIEYKSDYEKIFKGFELPLIKNYNDVESVVNKWLNDVDQRNKFVSELRNYTFQKYNPADFINRILSFLYG
ncbi:MAG: glycosyltransferase [Melioribacteraceae bacterium]|nr:glycosyltransferase [Melioribacteraceae bacterium]